MATKVLRSPAEMEYRDELDALRVTDKEPRPPGWQLSPRAVRSFICGSESPAITRKFFGNDILVERAIVSLASNRGLLLIGEPGTAKTMLSELLAAAISGISTNTIQGSAGTTEDQIKYSWNYALLLAEGPSTKALVPAPMYVAMNGGVIARFEEITRCPPEIQDVLIGLLSDKVMMVPELKGEDRVVLARPGFNVIATANSRDRGVHEMSSALKRRFNFETVSPIQDLELEITLVKREAERLLTAAEAPMDLNRDVVGLLVQTFHELRGGATTEGVQIERPTSVMSTAEAVSVAMAAGLDAFHYGKRQLSTDHVCRHLASTVTKDAPEDLRKLTHYFDVIVKQRSAKEGGAWKDFLKSRKWLD